MIVALAPVLLCVVTARAKDSPADRSDTSLLRDWQGGDRSAGRWLFARHVPAVRRYFQRKLRSEDAEDLVQRTFVGLVEAARRFRGEGSVPALLLAIARRQLCKFLRERGRRPDARATAADTIAAADRSPTSWLLSAEQWNALRDALGQLPDDHRIVLELYYWEEMPAPQIAELLHVSPITVRTRLHRARTLLESHLREHSGRSGY